MSSHSGEMNITTGLSCLQQGALPCVMSSQIKLEGAALHRIESKEKSLNLRVTFTVQPLRPQIFSWLPITAAPVPTKPDVRSWPLNLEVSSHLKGFAGIAYLFRL